MNEERSEGVLQCGPVVEYWGLDQIIKYYLLYISSSSRVECGGSPFNDHGTVLVLGRLARLRVCTGA